MPDTSQNNRLEKREALDLALFHKLTSGDPESFVSQFFVLLAHVMKHSSNGSQPPQLGELAAHLADLKKSEALRISQAPEIRKYLEQLNATQGDILKRLRTLPASPARGDTWGKRLAWQVGIGLGILLIGFLLGTLIESRKENEHLSSVIRSLPYSLQAPAFATIARRRGWHNQRRRAARHVVWRPAGPVDFNRSQARSYFTSLSRSVITRS